MPVSSDANKPLSQKLRPLRSFHPLSTTAFSDREESKGPPCRVSSNAALHNYSDGLSVLDSASFALSGASATRGFGGSTGRCSRGCPPRDARCIPFGAPVGCSLPLRPCCEGRPSLTDFEACLLYTSTPAEPHGALKARSCFPPFPQNQLDRPGNLCRVGNFLDRLYAMASPRPIGGGHCGDFGV